MQLRESRIIGLFLAVFILATFGFFIKRSMEVFFDYADGKTSVFMSSPKIVEPPFAVQRSADDSIQQVNATVISRISALRNDADDNAPLIANLTQHTPVEFLKIDSDWIYIKTQSGMLGWARRDTLKVQDVTTSENAFSSDSDPHSLPKFPNNSFERNDFK